MEKGTCRHSEKLKFCITSIRRRIFDIIGLPAVRHKADNQWQQREIFFHFIEALG